jgi:hypothetical protein
VTDDGTCAFDSAWTVTSENGACSATLTCGVSTFPTPPGSLPPDPVRKHYSISCGPADGGSIACACAVDGATTRTVSFPELPACDGLVAVRACGFSPWVVPKE